MRRLLGGLRAALLALALPCAAAPPSMATLIDDFADPSRWRAAASDQVRASLRAEPGALCLDYDFAGVSGYAFVRRELPLQLPAHYAFELKLRGSGPANDLQLKFADAGGDNVWWLNRQRFAPPAASTTLRIRQRQIEFAWGPTTDRTLREAAAIEFVVAASLVGGGKGTLCLERLTLHELPPPPATLPPVRYRASAGDAAALAAGRAWRAPPGAQALQIDLGLTRELNGVLLRWLPGRHARDYDVEASDDGIAWRTLREVRDGDGGSDALFLPELETRHLRLALRRGAPRGYALAAIEPKTPAQWPHIDAAIATLAAAAPRGRYPRAYAGEQSYWTLVGTDAGAARSGLLGEDGAIELGRGAPSVEPFVLLDGARAPITWADVRLEHSLRDGYLPQPRVRWRHPAFTLDIDAAADGDRERSQLLARYTLRNRGPQPLRVTLRLALRPFQVNPPQQMLSTPGGTAPLRALAWRDGALHADGRLALKPRERPARVEGHRFGATPRPLGAEPLADPQALAAATLDFTLELPPRGERSIAWAAPLAGGAADPADIDARFDRAAAHWRERLNRLRLQLPREAQPIHDTLRSAHAQILLSRDGAALMPGTRSYARSWVRDGAMMSAGLLRLGEVQAVREYLDWFAPRIFASGKVPCCIDARGADPVVENDSHGQFIYTVAELWRHTGDIEMLRRHWPQVEAAVRYMDTLRRSERSDAVRDDPGRAAWFGLLPKSISHEGYAQQPVHSYWDDFWALRGFKDAVQIAAALGRDADAARFADWRDEFARDLAASIELASAQHRIDFVPGAAELGDFDPTSTTIALNPAQAEPLLKPERLRNTFERYWAEAVARRNGRRDWVDYTPYELRNVGALVRLGQPTRAHALLDFFFADQRPAGWNQWAEVVMREPRRPKFLGDMPHAWVSSDYIRSVLDLFAFEREADRSIVIGAGVPREWLRGDGVALAGLSTPNGPLGWRLREAAGGWHLRVDSGLRLPAGGVVLRWPGDDALPRALVDGRELAWEGRELRLRSLPVEVELRR